jgi:hypothetical protein
MHPLRSGPDHIDHTSSSRNRALYTSADPPVWCELSNMQTSSQFHHRFVVYSSTHSKTSAKYIPLLQREATRHLSNGPSDSPFLPHRSCRSKPQQFGLELQMTRSTRWPGLPLQSSGGLRKAILGVGGYKQMPHLSQQWGSHIDANF